MSKEKESQVSTNEQSDTTNENTGVSKREEKERRLQDIKEQESQVTSNWLESLKKGEVIDQPEYFQMKHYLNMAIDGDETGVIIKSRGGSGKTYTTLTYMAKRGVECAYMNSFSTVTMFYIWLYKNRNNVKVIDDVHKLLESDKFSPFLKAILEGFNGERVVFYNTSKTIEDNEGQYPNSFMETGCTIILTNRINEKNAHIDAILSRVPMCELEISNERMLELMGYIAKQPYKSMSVAENMEVLEFCKKELHSSVDLNLRTFNHARNFYIYAKRTGDMSLWGRLILQSLKKDDTDMIIIQTITDEAFADDDARISAINSQLTNPISRATFYRKKKKLMPVVSQ